MGYISILDCNNISMSSSYSNDITIEDSIKNYIISNNYNGYRYKNKVMLYNAFYYWKLLDDNKISGKSQSLISDLFNMHKVNKGINKLNQQINKHKSNQNNNNPNNRFNDNNVFNSNVRFGNNNNNPFC